MKKVSILLTEYSDHFSRLIYYITGRGYTHVSLGLEEDDDRFYSFNFKGFCVETTEKHRRRGVKKSVCYRIDVTDESYRKLKDTVQFFEQNCRDYHYTRAGVLFAVLHMPFQRDKHYFCSQFVAELLDDSGAIKLGKAAGLYLPNQMPGELEACHGLSQIIPDFV